MSFRDIACEIPLNDELLTSFSGRGRRRLRDLKQATETVLKLDRHRNCLQVRGTERSIADLREHLETLIGHRRSVSPAVWAELMRTRTQTTSDAAIQYIQEQSGCRVHVERTTQEVRLYGCEKNLKMADKLLKELAEETDIQVVQGMVSPELLEHIALSMGVTLRVQDTYIEVLGRKDATQSASAELEKLLQKAGFCEKTLEAETHSIQSQSTIPSPQPPSPQGPKIAEMGQHLQNIHGQTQPVENRCPTCHCGRFCGTCGAQIWQTIPVFNMAPMPAVSTMNTMNSLGMAVTGYGMGTEMSGLSKEDDSPAAQTPDPAEECGHPTMMFPMFQMAQAPYVLVPAESGQMGQCFQFAGQF